MGACGCRNIENRLCKPLSAVVARENGSGRREARRSEIPSLNRERPVYPGVTPAAVLFVLPRLVSPIDQLIRPGCMIITASPSITASGLATAGQPEVQQCRDVAVAREHPERGQLDCSVPHRLRWTLLNFAKQVRIFK